MRRSAWSQRASIIVARMTDKPGERIGWQGQRLRWLRAAIVALYVLLVVFVLLRLAGCHSYGSGV